MVGLGNDLTYLSDFWFGVGGVSEKALEHLAHLRKTPYSSWLYPNHR